MTIEVARVDKQAYIKDILSQTFCIEPWETVKNVKDANNDQKFRFLKLDQI